MNTPTFRQILIAAAASTALAGALAPARAQTVVTFDQGKDGWDGPQGAGGATFVTPNRGHGAPALRTVFNDFGITFRTTTNAAFVGDLTRLPSFELSIDVKTQSIVFFNSEVSREFVVELRDFDHPENGLPYTSVWYDLGTISAADRGWKHLAVTVADSSATALPTGWGGYGDEDPQTGAPRLPADRTFASVLAGVDEMVFTTYQPGFFYGETHFDVLVDNIGITPVPEPASAALLLVGLGVAGLAARRGRREGRQDC